MRSAFLFTSLISFAALAIGCSASSHGATSTLPIGNETQTTAHSIQFSEASGIAPSARYRAPIRQLRPNVVASGGIFALGVSDGGANAVELLDNSFTNTGAITSGILGPDGDAYDLKQNLYVSNDVISNVVEYAKGATSPTFTYSSGISDAVDVTTDSNQSVYVSDYNFGTNGYILQYPHRVNSAINTCTPGHGSNFGVESVAVNGHGDVFVSYNNSSFVGSLSVYHGGLSGCHETVLAPTVGYAGGLAFDKRLNLLICDQTGEKVDLILWPMYDSISASFSGFTDPFHITLNALGTLLYVADPAAPDVAVIKYPHGGTYATLGSGNGLTQPFGVAADNTGP